MVHHETSSGMLNSLEDVGKLAKKYGALFIVDCVSSAGAEIIDVEKCHIAFFSGSSSKAIASYPGLSFVVGKIEEFEKLKELPAKTTYLNLYKFYHFINTLSQTPNTPAVPLFYALDQALVNILEEGPANRYTSLKKRAHLLRKGMLALGLKFLIDQKEMCSVLTTVYIPTHIDLDAFRKKLRERSIIIYEGKSRFQNRVFQVGNIGDLSTDEIKFFLDAMREILQSFNIIETKNLVSIDDNYTASTCSQKNPKSRSLIIESAL